MFRPSTKFLIPNTLLLVLINKLSLTEPGSQRCLRGKWLKWRGQQNECSKSDLEPVRVNFHCLHYATADFLGRQVLIRDILWACLWEIVLINLIDVCRPSSCGQQHSWMLSWAILGWRNHRNEVEHKQVNLQAFIFLWYWLLWYD